METVTPLEALFARIETETQTFAQASGLACPSGCGACCLSPRVEATELEMDVMAKHLIATGEAEIVLEKIQSAGPSAACVLYRPQPGNPAQGRCGHYAQRPTICRLFAFAAVKNKYGKAQLAACHVHLHTQPEVTARTKRAVEAGELVAPLFETAANALLSIDPERGTIRLPINLALERSLQRLLLRKSMI